MIRLDVDTVLVHGRELRYLPIKGHERVTRVVDRDGREWHLLTGGWFRREDSGGFRTCRGTLAMLARDFGPLAGPTAERELVSA